jgi:hypothetical protein
VIGFPSGTLIAAGNRHPYRWPVEGKESPVAQHTFGIFEVFPDLAGRKAHVEGGGGDIFRDVERMNDILAEPAHVHKVDVLLSKQVFTA